MNRFYDGSDAARLPVLVSLCIVIGKIAIVMLQCLGCCDVFTALNSIYYEQLDILSVVGVHNVSQVVTSGSKHWPCAKSEA